VADLVDLDLNFVGGSAYDDDIGVWNGTGTCTTHHGESDCYADLYNLCVREATEGVVADYWPFTECMFSSQGELCADSWNGEDCGASAYNATLFDAVVSKCSAAAGLSSAAADALLDCAVTGSHSGMADAGKQLLLDDFAAAAEADSQGSPVWINVDGKLVDEKAYTDVDDWGKAVLEAICDSSAAKNPGSTLPSACSASSSSSS
jgi:hypothetical protein